MAGLALILGQALPVFASETGNSDVESGSPVRFDDILVYDNGSGIVTVHDQYQKPTSGTCVDMNEYNVRTIDVQQTTQPSDSGSKYAQALYHVPVLITIGLTGLLPNKFYTGTLSHTLDLSWSFSLNGWSRNSSTLYSVFSPDGNTEVNMINNTLQYKLRLQNFLSSSTTAEFHIYVVLESSYRANNYANCATAIQLSQTATVLNISVSAPNEYPFGQIYESNATPTEVAQSNFLDNYTMIQNQNSLLNWSSAFQQQQAIFQGNLISNLNLNHNIIHQDLQTIHHDLTDTNSPVADAQSDAAEAQSEAAAAESAFNDNADPEQISDDFDQAFDDSNNPMTSGELSNGLRFWWTLTNEWFASNDNEDANYPVYIQIFLNFLGRLW